MADTQKPVNPEELEQRIQELEEREKALEEKEIELKQKESNSQGRNTICIPISMFL